MPPRRKGTITAKEINGTISTEEIYKTSDNVSNQGEPLELAAAAKRQGRKVAIPAKEKRGADIVDVPSTIRSSKQKALQKILSMDKEDAEASALQPNFGERENHCSGTAGGAKHNNRKKQGPRTKKALKSIPEEDAMEANFVGQGSKIVPVEVKDVSEVCTNEVKPDTGTSRSVRAKVKDHCKLRTEQEEEQQGKDPQQVKMTTCHKASRKRGGSSMLAPGHSTTVTPIQAPGNLSKKTADCLSMPTEKPDPHSSALMACTQVPTKLGSKNDQALNVRSSSRTKKVVYYNEQSPRGDLNEKKVFVTTELTAQAASNRNASAAKLPPSGAKRVKEDPTTAAEETLALDSVIVTSVKRGRRHPQNLVDKKTVAFINQRETGNKEECREHKKESNSEQVKSSSAFFNSVGLDKALLLQTAQPESINFLIGHNAELVAKSPAQEGAKLDSATRSSLEKPSSTGSIMHEKMESDYSVHNQGRQKRSLPEKSKDQMMADESTSLEMLSIATGKGVVQQHKLSLKVIDEHSIQALQSVNDRKKINTSKGRKVNSKQRALPDAAQKAEGDLQDALPLESDEAKYKVLEAPLAQGAASSTTYAEPEEICGTHGSIDADKKLYCGSQNRGRNTFLRKRTLQGTAQQAKKQKISESNSLDTLPSRTAPAQNHENEKMIQGVDSQGWNAVDITNCESRVERSSEKKRREEVKRKRAMKFDALPVGFGLGISCWSTPPWANQSIEEGVVEVLDSSVMGFQVQSKSPMEEATKQLCLQETSMLKDANNTSLVLEDTHHALPCSATDMQPVSLSISDAKRLPGSSVKPAPKNDSNHQHENAKVKRQVSRKTKTSKALLLVSPSAVHKGGDNSMLDKENLEPKLHVDNDEAEVKMVHTGGDNNMLDKENLEPKLHVDNDEADVKMRRSSRRRIAAAGKEKTTRTKKQ